VKLKDEMEKKIYGVFLRKKSRRFQRDFLASSLEG
jgi:hypothetical protein